MLTDHVRKAKGTSLEHVFKILYRAAKIDLPTSDMQLTYTLVVQTIFCSFILFLILFIIDINFRHLTPIVSGKKLYYAGT